MRSLMATQANKRSGFFMIAKRSRFIRVACVLCMVFATMLFGTILFAQQNASIEIDTHKVVHAVPRTIFGGFMEPLRSAIYGGGIWAQLLENPSFEENLWSADALAHMMQGRPELSAVFENRTANPLGISLRAGIALRAKIWRRGEFLPFAADHGAPRQAGQACGRPFIRRCIANCATRAASGPSPSAATSASRFLCGGAIILTKFLSKRRSI